MSSVIAEYIWDWLVLVVTIVYAYVLSGALLLTGIIIRITGQIKMEKVGKALIIFSVIAFVILIIVTVIICISSSG